MGSINPATGEGRDVRESSQKRKHLSQTSNKGKSNSTNGKEPTGQCRRRKRCRFDPWVGKIPWRKSRQPTPVFLPGESHGQSSLAGYSPWGHKELDTTEQLITHKSSPRPQRAHEFPRAAVTKNTLGVA